MSDPMTERALAVLIEEVERIADNIEDQRREPDKTLCNVQSLRHVVAGAKLYLPVVKTGVTPASSRKDPSA